MHRGGAGLPERGGVPVSEYLHAYPIEAIFALGGILVLCRLAWEVRK